MEIEKSLSHIKNPIILNNCLNPLNNKHVKKVWVYKQTKMDRTKRDLCWEYYKDRMKNDVASSLLEAYYRNRKSITIIYFDDPVQYDIDISDEMATMLKTYVREKRKLQKRK